MEGTSGRSPIFLAYMRPKSVCWASAGEVILKIFPRSGDVLSVAGFSGPVRNPGITRIFAESRAWNASIWNFGETSYRVFTRWNAAKRNGNIPGGLRFFHVDIAQLVERDLAKVEVASSNLVVHSNISAVRFPRTRRPISLTTGRPPARCPTSLVPSPSPAHDEGGLARFRSAVRYPLHAGTRQKQIPRSRPAHFMTKYHQVMAEIWKQSPDFP